MPVSKPILLYLYPQPTVFVQRDLEMLAAHHTLHHHSLLSGPKALLPLRILTQLWFLLCHRAWRHDILCHFAGYHSVLPVLIGRRCFIILAGSDGANFPSINYGNFRKRLYGAATAFSVRRAMGLLPVDATLIEAEQTYDPQSPTRQGVRAHVSGLRTPWRVIHYGFDTAFWNVEGASPRDPAAFVCAASGAMPGNAVHFRKGVDLILAAAALMPHTRVTIAGCPDPAAYQDLPQNVQVLGRQDGEAMRMLYRGATFYLQPSMMEGFPNALCEAMLCGCVPIVSNVAAMPGIVGPIGHVLERRDAELLAGLMRTAMAETQEEVAQRAQQARDHAALHYPMQRRQDALLDVLEHGIRNGAAAIQRAE